MFDYETLRVLWWVLLGALLIGFAVMDGFDLGVAMLLPIIGRSADERRVMINTVGPVWEGNQVWLVLGAGAIFAAWPALYSMAFSSFYLAMLLVLLALILRPVGFTFRGKVDDPRWRAGWDAALFISGVVPALVFGVAFGNVLQGVPFNYDADLRLSYSGGLWSLLNPFALLCGGVSVAMLMAHGASYLALKTEGPIAQRAQLTTRIASTALFALFAAAGYWVVDDLDGYKLVSAMAHDGPSNPLGKSVITAVGAWTGNYQAYPWMLVAPLLGFAGALAAVIFAGTQRMLTFLGTGVACAGVVLTAGFSLFPFLMPSSLNPAVSLTVWDASSSATTLGVMALVTAVFLPMVLLYTAWVYRVLRGPVTQDAIAHDHHNFY
jgi:cytochrome d ubiquinol oxidase subunit II